MKRVLSILSDDSFVMTDGTVNCVGNFSLNQGKQKS